MCALTFAVFTKLSYSQSYSETKDKFVPCDVMPQLLHHFNADYAALQRFYVVRQSPARRARLENLYSDYINQLDGVDFKSLSQECKVDYLLFGRDLREKLRLSKEEANELHQVAFLFPFADKIYEAEKQRTRGTYLDSKKLAIDLHHTTLEIGALSTSLRDSAIILDATSIVRAEETINGLKTALNSVMEFYNGYDPLFTWWVPVPAGQVDSALTAYATVIKSKGKTLGKYNIIARTPVGKEELSKLLEHALIPYTIDELIAIATKEFEWCETEFRKVSRDMGFGDDWKKAVEFVKDTYVDPGHQPEAIYDLYKQSVDFVNAHDLVTAPPLEEEVWGMKMRPSERGSGRFFQGGRDITITYPTNNWYINYRLESMRGNNPNFSFATVHHELIPGHNATSYNDQRYRSYRNFGSSFSGEGWALYWEFLLWDMGFPKTNEQKIGMLFWRIHRAARIIFSSNFQMGNWTPDQCVDFLVNKVGHEFGNAIYEVGGHVRPNNYPLYQLSYLVGGLQFYSLKKELVDSGKMPIKEFHDNILHLSSMPVEMVRNIFLDNKLIENYQSNWKFYNFR